MSTRMREGALKPFIIAILSAGLTLAGTMVKDRVERASIEASFTARIDGIGKRVDEHEHRLTWMSENLTTRQELREDIEAVERRLDDIRTIVASNR